MIYKSTAEMLRQIVDDFAAMNEKYAPIIQQLERNLPATEPQATPHSTKLVVVPQTSPLAQDIDATAEHYCPSVSGRLT
jgi:hypothetical protein